MPQSTMQLPPNRASIVVVGSATVDLFFGGADHLPTMSGDGFRTSNLAWCREPLRMVVGGNGANTAYALGKLGATVKLFSSVGQDLLGDMLAQWLTGAGVDLALLRRREDAATSTTAIVTDTAQHQLAFHHAGAYAQTTTADLPVGWDAALGCLLLTSFPLMTGLSGAGYHTLLGAARTAGAITAVDLGPAIGQVATLAETAPLLRLVDVLIANLHEFTIFAGSADIAAIDAVLAAGAGCVVIKAGAGGARLYTAGRAPLHVPAFPTSVRQTVGAGDAFDAGLLYALLHGVDQGEALRWGNATAAHVVAAQDGMLSAPGAAQVAALTGG
jgi:sugar/nucleoside kinase (ribokinase family)